MHVMLCDVNSNMLVFAPDIGISQLFIVQFAISFQHNNQHLVTFHEIWDSIFLGKYFHMPLLQWKSLENMETFHHGLLTVHTAAILKEIPAMIYDGLRCS